MSRIPALRPLSAASCCLVLLTACASAPKDVGAPPSYAAIRGDAAPPRARLYTDCIGQAVAAGAVDMPSDHDSRMLRFSCSGAAARALFVELGPWSARIGSGWTAEGRTWRSTTKVRHDLLGIDHCSAADGAGADARCILVMNVGEFLTDGR